jgi:hypothetical protein
MTSMLKPNAALVAACIPDWPPLNKAAQNRVKKDVQNFLRDEFALIPWFIVAPMYVLQCVFLTAAFLSAPACLFGRLPHTRQENFIRIWQKFGLPFQAYIRLYRSLAMLAFMEHEEVRKELALPDYAQHQALFRAKRRVLKGTV